MALARDGGVSDVESGAFDGLFGGKRAPTERVGDATALPCVMHTATLQII
jgi:hypothetical protein